MFTFAIKLKYMRLILLFLPLFILSQKPQKPNAVQIFHQIEKLNVLASVLYVAAHPDDENTRMIAYFANDIKAHTGYLSLTRGDGGQNLIGTELREALGYIRTHELIEARKIDGGVQYFTRANDFGYSKMPDETLKIWSRAQVIEDMIYVIRKHQPDIIINRFDHRSPGTTHGHHTASAQLALEIFEQVSDKSVFPKQLELVELANPKRLFFNTSWWFFGGRDKFEKADKSKLYPVNIGGYYPSVGLSNQEIAALSRSQHQSQGFGSTGTRGDDIEYLELLKGDFTTNKNVFEGIDTSWNRVKNGKFIGEKVAEIIKQYDFTKPSKSLNQLLEVRQLISELQDSFWKNKKTEEINQIIYEVAGLYLEGISNKDYYTPGETIDLKIEAINRSDASIKLKNISINGEKSEPLNENLNFNSPFYKEIQYKVASNESFTNPYWLNEKPAVGMFNVNDQNLIGLPENPSKYSIQFDLEVNGVPISFKKPLVYKFNSPQFGETYKPLRIVPEASLSFNENIQILKKGMNKKVAIKLKSFKKNLKGRLKLIASQNISITPESITIGPLDIDEEVAYVFEIKSNKNEVEENIAASFESENATSSQFVKTIAYSHIPIIQMVETAKSTVKVVDIKTTSKLIGYIMGAGDELPKYLSDIGYEVKNLAPEDITEKQLEKITTIIVGIRAYNTLNNMNAKQKILFEHVKKGHNLIVQYNTSGKLTVDQLAPYSLKISRDRVTEEDAKVTFLAPNHPVLNYPNKISNLDFEGWSQEQGLYYPNEWDNQFVPILESADTGEQPKKGALLVAKYGKGYYIYTGLSFFRQIPAGVVGAYRILTNMIELKD